MGRKWDCRRLRKSQAMINHGFLAPGTASILRCIAITFRILPCGFLKPLHVASIKTWSHASHSRQSERLELCQHCSRSAGKRQRIDAIKTVQKRPCEPRYLPKNHRLATNTARIIRPAPGSGTKAISELWPKLAESIKKSANATSPLPSKSP